MAKGISILADQERMTHYESLMKLSDRDLCEMVRAHFASHPALPGEKTVKDEANQRLAQMDADNGCPDMSAEEKEALATKYAQTRVRETPLKEGLKYLNSPAEDRTGNADSLIRTTVDSIQEANGTVNIDMVAVSLEKKPSGEVAVYAETWLQNGEEGHSLIGHLPDSFLKNNPMNVDSCDAQLQIADYSNGKGKNISARVVVDTDLMSGDVIDLDESALMGIDQEEGLAQ